MPQSTQRPQRRKGGREGSGKKDLYTEGHGRHGRQGEVYWKDAFGLGGELPKHLLSKWIVRVRRIKRNWFRGGDRSETWWRGPESAAVFL